MLGQTDSVPRPGGRGRGQNQQNPVGVGRRGRGRPPVLVLNPNWKQQNHRDQPQSGPDCYNVDPRSWRHEHRQRQGNGGDSERVNVQLPKAVRHVQLVLIFAVSYAPLTGRELKEFLKYRPDCLISELEINAAWNGFLRQKNYADGEWIMRTHKTTIPPNVRNPGRLPCMEGVCRSFASNSVPAVDTEKVSFIAVLSLSAVDETDLAVKVFDRCLQSPDHNVKVGFLLECFGKFHNYIVGTIAFLLEDLNERIAILVRDTLQVYQVCSASGRFLGAAVGINRRCRIRHPETIFPSLRSLL